MLEEDGRKYFDDFVLVQLGKTCIEKEILCASHCSRKVPQRSVPKLNGSTEARRNFSTILECPPLLLMNC